MLGERYGLRSYLEICTPSTGLTFDAVNGAWFIRKHRLVYNAPEEHDDGGAYTFRTALPSSASLTRARAAGPDGPARYDVVFGLQSWTTRYPPDLRSC